MKRLMIAAALSLAAGAAHAEVAERTDAGFRTRNVVEIAATPQRVYAALGEIGRWWGDAHTYSGKAVNMSIRLEPGACFCEALPNGGGVRHGVVVLAWPDQGTLRIEAVLGPLQDEGAAGALTFVIKPKGAGVEVVQTYNVGGLRPASAKTFPDPVDQVIGTQLKRLKAYVETGKPG